MICLSLLVTSRTERERKIETPSAGTLQGKMLEVEIPTYVEQTFEDGPSVQHVKIS